MEYVLGGTVTHACFMPAANGTACTDFDISTVGDVCRGGVCVGIPATCGNQNVTCPLPNQRLNFTRSCVPGTTCNAATCCRACSAINLITNGGFSGSLAGWTNGGWTFINSTSFWVGSTGVIGVPGAQNDNNVPLAQSGVCNHVIAWIAHVHILTAC
jgi:hypothetical protein